MDMAASLCSFEEGETQVLFERHISGLKVTLNRPKKLNSLTYEMVSRIFRVLKKYENDSEVNIVILKGNGKAFCAGGDVARVVQSAAFGHWTFATMFYRKQLIVDHQIAKFRKPVVSIINGIAMGGGAGLSIHAKFRVVTENTVFAMPEATLGLFPDVGSSHFLSRLPGCLGEYLGLTGARMDGTELLVCGLATHFVLSKDLVSLENALCELDSTDAIAIHKLIDRFGHKMDLRQDSCYRRLETINKCFSRKTVEEILSCLEGEAAIHGDKWVSNTITAMSKAAPMSLKLALRVIRDARVRSLEECLMLDYVTACNIFRGKLNKNFYEGARALIFDKDRKPKWQPSQLQQITDEMVDVHFDDLKDDEWEPLKFPLRSSTAVQSRL